jgi:hypothetical protein
MPIQNDTTPTSHIPDELPIKTGMGPQGSPTTDKPKSGGPTRGGPRLAVPAEPKTKTTRSGRKS